MIVLPYRFLVPALVTPWSCWRCGSICRGPTSVSLSVPSPMRARGPISGLDPLAIKRHAFGIAMALAVIAGAALVITGPIDPSAAASISAGCSPSWCWPDGHHPRHLVAAFLIGVANRSSWVPQPVLGAGRRLRHSSRNARPPAERIVRGRVPMLPFMRSRRLSLAAPPAEIVPNPYYFYAGYVMLQFVVIATGWNILGGYAGYTISALRPFSAPALIWRRPVQDVRRADLRANFGAASSASSSA